MNVLGTLSLQTVEGAGLLMEARFASGKSVRYDSGPDATIANPVEALLGALAACEAMDVICILRKKRIDVTAYDVAMDGERAETPPKRFTAITLTHRITGRGVPRDAVEEAVRLSEEKYCSVHHSLDPAMRITNRVEILEG